MSQRPLYRESTSASHAQRKLTAVLGPTNTGKTHFAIERMLGHRSGMIGLPLRLLAREVFDKIVQIKGVHSVALITGEERIIPPHSRYYVCTVEAMPVDIPVAFLAVDEIQLATDPERGHVFTDRLLHARGEEETMWLGALTMRGAIARVAPETHFLTRPRFSNLSYTGPKKLSRLPRRSAIVAFSIEDVYTLADTVRNQRGGAAVVLGALSPRTRNAQVALYQSGDVDFLIATDAIGMGINMDIDHVAFAARDKFDGVVVRPLKPEELGQIAGRAGRFMNDGSFGVTDDIEPLPGEIVSQVENHRYDPIRVLQWRNNSLDFTSLDKLLASLDMPPPGRGLMRTRPTTDHLTLQILSRDDGIRGLTRSPAALKLLWKSCRLPDFRKLTPDEHAQLVSQIFHYLVSREGVLPEDWLSRQLQRLDVMEGDVDTLSGRLARIRTWTYAAHQAHWTRDPAHWQKETRAIEDRLSDALHERLTQRFIDRRTSLLMRHLRDEETLIFNINESGSVSLGTEYLGKLDGLHFIPDPSAEGIHGRTLRAAASTGIESTIGDRAYTLAADAHDAITLDELGRLHWRGSAVGKLVSGSHPLLPNVAILADDLLKGFLRELVHARLEAWIASHFNRHLWPLLALKKAADAHTPAEQQELPSSARGLAFRLAEQLGQIELTGGASDKGMRDAARPLRRFGVKAGRHSIYLPHFIKPASSHLTALLWTISAKPISLPSFRPGLTSFALDKKSVPEAFLAASHYRRLGNRAVRIDIVERVEVLLAEAARTERDANHAASELSSLLGCSIPDAIHCANALGWEQKQQKSPVATNSYLWHQNRSKSASPQRRTERCTKNLHSPFAGLAVLVGSD